MRLGSIGFVNSLPVDWGIQSGAVSLDARIVRGTPAALNDLILAGSLDVAPVSAFWYGKYQSEFILLPDLAIGSDSGVHSVLVLTRRPIGEAREGWRVAFSGEGRTTPSLLEILCRRRFGFKPTFVPRPPGTLDIPAGADALLVLGDEALQAKEKYSAVYSVLDLAEEWRAWTGCPIVFAVWAARKKYYSEHPEKVMTAHEALLESKRWGAAHSQEILAEAERRTGLSTQILSTYFSVLSYRLDESMRLGMRRYFQEASALGLLEPVAALEEIPMPNGSALEENR